MPWNESHRMDERIKFVVRLLDRITGRYRAAYKSSALRSSSAS